MRGVSVGGRRSRYYPDVTLCSSLQPHTSPHHSFSSADLKPSLGPGCTAQNPWFTFQGSLAANQPCPCVPPAGRLSAVATGLGCQVGRSKRTPVREGGNLCIGMGLEGPVGSVQAPGTFSDSTESPYSEHGACAHWSCENIMYETSCQSRFDARYWMLGVFFVLFSCLFDFDQAMGHAGS